MNEVLIMFLNVHVKNYKSLIDFQFILMEKKDNYKELALVYGENGSGKTNIVSVFYTLIETLQTTGLKNFIEDMLSKEKDDLPPESLIELLRSQISDTEKIIKKNKTIGVTNENLFLQFDFVVDGQTGSYTVEFDDEKVISEKLDYQVEKRKSTLFNLSTKNIFLHSKMFASKEYSSEIATKIKKYWGKHTLMSILVFEFMEKNSEYIKENVNSNFTKVLESFANVHCYADFTVPLSIISEKNLPLNGEFLRGVIGSGYNYELDEISEILTDVFSSLYSDIKQLYYEVEYRSNGDIEYELYLKKMIGGKMRVLPFKLESKGTTNILKLLTPLLLAIQGKTVILDEFDAGIHDILVRDLFEEISNSISGQLIMTTHNTLLLESEVENKYLYIISIDEEGNKEIHSLDKYDLRVHKNHNRRSQYLKGLYHGVPIVGNLDFELVADQLKTLNTKADN